MISDQDSMKLEINNRTAGKFTDTCKLNNILLNNQWIKDEIKREIKSLETKWNMKMETQHSKIYGM